MAIGVSGFCSVRGGARRGKRRLTDARSVTTMDTHERRLAMNSRLAVAVHILTLLEGSKGEPLTSEYIAGSVNTNASLVRRLLGVLARAGLTTAQMGAGGGAMLARPADRIT